MPSAAFPPRLIMVVSAMAAIIFAAQELDVHREPMQSRQEQQDDAPPAQMARSLPPAPQPGIIPEGPSALPDRAQGPPAPSGPPPMQGKTRTPGQGECSPHNVPAAKKSGPPKLPMAVGATPKGKAAPCRGTPAMPLEEAASKKTGEAAPQGDPESSYSYSESQSSETHAQGTERRTAEEKPRTPSGERPRTPPKPDTPRKSSGGREQRSGSPPGGQPHARPAPPQRGSPRQGRRTEFVQVIHSVDRRGTSPGPPALPKGVLATPPQRPPGSPRAGRAQEEGKVPPRTTTSIPTPG